jgi:hypothetical protein
MVLVVVLPLLELVGEDPGVVDHHPLEKALELFGVDALGAFHFVIQARGAGLMSRWPTLCQVVVVK